MISILMGLLLSLGTYAANGQGTGFEASEPCDPNCNSGTSNFSIGGATVDGNSGVGAIIDSLGDPDFYSDGVQALVGQGGSSFRIFFTADVVATLTFHFAHGTCTGCGSFPASLGNAFDINSTLICSVNSIDVSSGADATVSLDKDVDCGGSPIDHITFNNGVVDGMSWTYVTLPVELTAFEAHVDRQDITLTWQTDSEQNNAGFEVLHRTAEDAPFESIGFVEGAGNSSEARLYRYEAQGLARGRHFFRLKQFDFSGAFDYSPQVSTSLGLPGTYQLSAPFPNPFAQETQLRLTVAQQQHVAASVFDVLGRRVHDLFDGIVPANADQLIRFEGGNLSSGLYIVRVKGERFTTIRQVILLN